MTYLTPTDPAVQPAIILEKENIMTPEQLRVGDTVQWRGGWGSAPPKLAVVTAIQQVELGEKYGDPVEAMPWALVPRYAVVDLDNGHWAYGRQIGRSHV